MNSSVVRGNFELLFTEQDEVPSTISYPPEFETKSLSEQVSCLQRIFSDLGPSSTCPLLHKRIERGEVELPEGADGWYAVLNREKPGIFGSSYIEDVQTMTGVLRCSRAGRFKHEIEVFKRFLEDHLVRSARTQSYLFELSKYQGHPDVLIIPAQTGLRYRGVAPVRSRTIIGWNEFALDTFTACSIVMTHRDRLNSDSLWFDCPADMFHEEDSSARTSCFHAMDKRAISLAIRKASRADDRFGSATGFLIDDAAGMVVNF